MKNRLAADVFNPIHLFHLFLAEVPLQRRKISPKSFFYLRKSSFISCCKVSVSLLQISYDHQVLLDYLISKDTGSICAEYLLRFVFETSFI